MATIEEIKQSAKEEREKIVALDMLLANESDECDDDDRLDEIDNQRLKLGEALRELSMDNIDKLEASNISELQNKLTKINGDLKGTLDHLEKIEKYAEKTAEVVSGMAELTAKLATVVA